MKRMPEFILGLIGGIVAIAINAFFVIFVGFLPVTMVSGGVWASYWISLIASIAVLVLSCLINKNTKTNSKIIIVLSIIILFTDLWTFVPVTLLIIAGIMGIVRKTD